MSSQPKVGDLSVEVRVQKNVVLIKLYQHLIRQVEVDIRRGDRRELYLLSGYIGCLRLLLISVIRFSFEYEQLSESVQVFESPMSRVQSSFSTEKEHRSLCTATQGTYEKLVHPQKSREMAGRARDLEIATSTLLGRNPIEKRSPMSIRSR